MRTRVLVLAALVGLSACATTTHTVLPEVAGLARAPRGPAIPLLPDVERPPRAAVSVTPTPATSRQATVNAPSARGKLIEVSIAKQRFYAWQNGRVVMSGPVSTGMSGYDTPTGHFRVIFKSPEWWSAQWGVWMPWALNFHGDYFIHQLTHYPNSTMNIGASKLGTRASHGCVRVGLPAAELLYRWSTVGTPVWVH
ncbi:MAG: L,D-transpeptidase [Actinomycetota bacterium]